jgi:hypothetical protein
MRTKSLIALAIVAVLLISFFAFLPKQTDIAADTFQQNGNYSMIAPSATPTDTASTSPSNLIEEASHETNSGNFQATSDTNQVTSDANPVFWQGVATNAWQYFQPGLGVDANTGLPSADSYYHLFTDWDLGVYIEAVISARNIELITDYGAWGSSMRLEKVVNFLETRDLNNYSFPFWFYQSEDGKNCKPLVGGPIVDIVDEGRLLLALNSLRTFNTSLASRINNVVFNRSNYIAAINDFQNDFSPSVFYYMAASGFACFWPNELNGVKTKIMDKIYAGGNVTTYGVTLPKADILCEPLLYLVFEPNNNDSRVVDLTYQVYLAHEARYIATGEFVAYSEGNDGYGNFIYEWVVMANGDTWKTHNPAESAEAYTDPYPIAYTKISLSFLALYNTTYTQDLSAYLDSVLPSPQAIGYYDGSTHTTSENNGRIILQIGCNTNGLIITAARYALQK